MRLNRADSAYDPNVTHILLLYVNERTGEVDTILAERGKDYAQRITIAPNWRAILSAINPAPTCRVHVRSSVWE